MGDLLAFKGFENKTATFSTKEHDVLYKTGRQYLDFAPSNDYNQTCDYPRFYLDTGYPVETNVTNQLVGCFNSDFDQYGDIEAFGVHPDWQRSLAKFASVQDRLREWVPSVRERLERFSCITIQQLDIDGFRFDKATQITVDALGNHSAAVRECASRLGKKNFFLPGEITGGNNYGSIYLGRGRTADKYLDDIATAMNLTTKKKDELANSTTRDLGQNALDAAAFHYSVYRFLTRFLGMSGNLEAGFDLPLNWVDMWSQIVLTNDLVNANTGNFDPRHMYGTSNQDVFRWPSIAQGIERLLMGFFITTLHMPGLPLLLYGEEQAFYILDSTADNYIFGRQAFTASQGWRMHGCYTGASTQYVNWPIEAARHGCTDEMAAYDHRDPSHPVRNILKSMYAMRENFDTFSEAWLLQPIGNQTFHTILSGSNTTGTEFGIWSVARAFQPTVQGKFASSPVWLVYHNQNVSTTYRFDCEDEDKAFYAPFDQKSTVKNLFYPWDTITLGTSTKSWHFSGSSKNSGCISEITMAPFEFRAYVPKSDWKGPPPMITKFTPGHDVPLLSNSVNGEVNITFEFSKVMDCDGLNEAISITSVTENGNNVTVTKAKCKTLASDKPVASYAGSIPSKFRYSATLTNVDDGVHRITIKNASTKADHEAMNSVDHFLLRVGGADNPIVFPTSANYSKTLVINDNNKLFVNHSASGANKWRFSTNWGSTWSNWTAYTGGIREITRLPWSGTSLQSWSGDHVMVQYWSQLHSSSSFMQAGDSSSQFERRFPHLFVEGTFNKFGFDVGVANQMSQISDGVWQMHLMDEWPAQFQLNVWGMNPDGKPDASWVYGDVDFDGILDRMPPTSLALNVLNATNPPPLPYLSYQLLFNDASLTFTKQPQGSMWIQIIMFILLAVLPVVGGLTAVWIFLGSFYKVKVNKVGFKKQGLNPFGKLANRLSSISFENFRHGELGAVPLTRRKVLLATIEYNIDDWNIKVKIGGLGVMAQLMGKALKHQDLIWVVPCVGGVEYPVDQRAEPMYILSIGKMYEIDVQYHQVQNITYVLLDAPIFRQQTKSDPYPPRMDDINSAIYYSAWNYCIAEVIRRFDPDLYHINDYHGAAAPLHLLPERTIPCILSLHNAEFQGLWPMRTAEGFKEVCEVFDLDPKIVKEYVQFGSVFNLLHAGASYLRVHQKGFGAVGVSKKYGDRSYARYPIFWGLSKVGQLPNPDPSDMAEWTRDEEAQEKDADVNMETESKRGDRRKQAQEWAGLEINPNAELFVFVGRWSIQKGVDLIADIFPSILEKHKDVQLICIGPVIDLYGKFAALKLAKLMEKYPKRVYSKPEFTALPPYIFSGAEFALIPSRDEPFGLVAVEFGRQGALGVGARVGGLGQMPGFWYTIESMAPQHLLQQFCEAITRALESKAKMRQKMRAWSAKQRFPVAQWVEDVDKLQSMAIRIHNREAKKRRRITSGSLLSVPFNVVLHAPGGNRPSLDDSGIEAPLHSARQSRASSLSVPNIIETDYDVEASRRAISNPLVNSAHLAAAPTLGTPGSPPINATTDSADEPALPRNPMFLNQSASSSVSSLATISNEPGSRLSVDTFAMHMMSPDESETRPQAFGRHSPQSPPDASLNFQHGDQWRSSRLSVENIIGERHDLKLQIVEPFFTDVTGEYYKAFEQKLVGMTSKNSDTDLCIEDYLKESEKEWFKHFHNAKLGRSRSPSRTRSPAPSMSGETLAPLDDDMQHGEWQNRPDSDDEFLLGPGYKPPKGFKKWLSIRIGDWPIYSFILAIGQIMASNSYQIVLLAGEASQTAVQLYIVAGTYGVTSILWWLTFRRLSTVYTLSLPWLFYGFAFVLLGVAPFMPENDRGPLHDAATAMYAAGASSGSMFFAMNFGDEGNMATRPSHFFKYLRSLTGCFSWRSNLGMDLPCGHHPGYPAAVRCRTVVLG
jgi:alpha-1,3-glucan synthase